MDRTTLRFRSGWPYSINSALLDPNGPQNFFEVDTSGSIRTTRTLDFESDPTSFNLDIIAKDAGGLIADANFTISILNQNEPPFGLSLSNHTIEENRPAGSVVGQISASDPDGDAIIFSLDSPLFEPNGPQNFFEVDTSGSIRTTRTLDFESDPTSFNLNIIAKDAGGLIADANFTISILNIPEGVSDFVLSNSTILKGSPIGSRIGQISASDPDKDKDDLRFALAPDEAGNLRHFFIDEDGNLSLQNDLEPGVYELTIQAFNGDKPVGIDSISVTILADDFIEPTGKEYHDSALMVTEVEAVDNPLRSGHNPIIEIEDRGTDGLFVNTAQPHGRKTGDSVVLTGVEGLQIKGLKNWNFLIDEVEETSFRIRQFGKDDHGHYDGTLGPLAEPEANTQYVSSPTDFLLGEWTFGHLVGNMVAEKDDPMEFMRHFSSQWTHIQRVNGYKTDPRRPLLSDDPEMNLANLPFRLLAIGNRLDLFAAKSINEVLNAGEGRFVFTLTKEFQLPQKESNSYLRISRETSDESRFTLIFEYGQKAKDFHTLAQWTRDWHALGRLRKEATFEEYLTHLAKMGDRFTKRGADPEKPNGNSINQVRTNDFILGSPLANAEFNLFSLKAAQKITNRWTKLKSDVSLSGEQVGLWTTTTKGNPMVLVPNFPENAPKQPADANYTVNDRRGKPLHAESKFLGEWINGMEAKILDGEVAPPSPGWMVGGIADQPHGGEFNKGDFLFSYRIPGVRVNQARHKFSLSTCSGCHTGDTDTFFQMIKSGGFRKGVPRRASMARFMTGNPRRKNATPHPLSHEVEDLVNKSKSYFFDLQDREDIVRDALKVIDLVYQSKIGLTEVALPEFTKAGEEITRVFVEGGVLSDWNFELVNGLGDQDNELFTIDSDGFVRTRANLRSAFDRAIQIRIAAQATDGSGVVIERPFSLWLRAERMISIFLPPPSREFPLPILISRPRFETPRPFRGSLI